MARGIGVPVDSRTHRSPPGAKIRLSPAQLALAATLVAAAGFSFYQTGSPLFDCGRAAGPEVKAWLAFCAVQSALFMGSAMSERARRAYAVLQYVALALAGFVLGQIALAYPRVFVFMILLAGFYWMLAAAPAVLRGRRPAVADDAGAMLVETTVFLLLFYVVHSAAAFLVVHRPGLWLNDRTFWLIAAMSACACAVLVRAGPRLGGLPAIDALPPFALLAVVLLRAKVPDLSFDAQLYKSTVPLMIADWRTALTGIFDHNLVGTNLSEIAGSQLRLLDPDYPPALISTLSFIALWILAPVASRRLFPFAPPDGDLWARSATLLMVSISEALLAAGTSYREPLMSVLMTAFLLPTPLAWIFLAAALATMATVVYAVPVLVALRFVLPRAAGTPGPWRERLRALVPASTPRRAMLAGCLALAAFVGGEQLWRNLAMTGRIAGALSVLEAATDPESAVLTPVQSPHAYEQMGTVAGDTFIHALTMDRWIPVKPTGFHILPSSRLAAIAVVFAACLAVFPSLRRSWLNLALFALWLACALEMLTLFRQGRYFAPLSFAAALLVPMALAAANGGGSGRGAGLVALSVALVAMGDQAVGTFSNVAWDCRRPFATALSRIEDQPATELEARLGDIVGQYRARAPNRGTPPSILCERDVGPTRYLGTHYVFATLSLGMLERHLAADPRRAELFPTSVLAVCFKDAAFVERRVPAAVRDRFQEVAGVGGVRILVSTPLMNGAAATSFPGLQIR